MTEPTDAEIDEVTVGILGYAALDKKTNETARMIARAVLAKWGAPPAVAGEPVGCVWQHEETGRTGFVDCWQVENGWQENNPQLRLVSKLYTSPPAVAPWRSAVLDLIDECPGLTMEQAHWLSRRVKELDFTSTPQPTQAQAGAGDVASLVQAAQDFVLDPTSLQKKLHLEAQAWGLLAYTPQPAQAQAVAVLTADDLKQPRNGKQWRVEWWNESCRMLLPVDKKLDRFQAYRTGTLMFTIKDKPGIKGGQHGDD